MVWTHFVFFFVPLCFFAIYPVSKLDVDPQDVPLLLETMSWQPIYCVLLPSLLFWRKKVMESSHRNVVKKISTNQSEAFDSKSDIKTSEQIRHFELLKELWIRN
uniref:ATP synthase F0 subunit 8 n=1 Tax=Plectus sambesii TaxID=2011161 RepID=A0A914VYN0_9BILA